MQPSAPYGLDTGPGTFNVLRVDTSTAFDRQRPGQIHCPLRLSMYITLRTTKMGNVK
ncbi:hypothetical protein Dimus_024646, partial [Dionaea muscipula]